MIRRRNEEVPEWRQGADWRVVCPCQQHRASSPWRRALRVTARGVAVLAGIPLAMAAIDVRSSAMNLNLNALRSADLRTAKLAAPATEPATAPAPAARQLSSLPIFTTDTMREQFLPQQRPFTLELFKESYFRSRVPYGAIIYREARRNDLSPELVAAMVHTESDFRASLVSHKSAQGLMQIIPSTAAILGIDDDPFDPEKNIAAGTKYYRYLLDRFDDETIALAAYNAGEGNVARFGGVPPFTETRDYISKVNRRTRRYRESFRISYIATARMRRALN